MVRCVVLLRGVNVGTRNRLAMPDFVAALESVGATEVRTYVQSGNAVASVPSVDGLVPRVEAALRAASGLDVRAFVRTGEELAGIVRANPYPRKVETPKLLHVGFLDGKDALAVAELVQGRYGDDEVALVADELYVSYAVSSLESPLVKLWPKLGVGMTTRNWSTVTKLLAMVG